MGKGDGQAGGRGRRRKGPGGSAALEFVVIQVRHCLFTAFPLPCNCLATALSTAFPPPFLHLSRRPLSTRRKLMRTLQRFIVENQSTCARVGGSRF